jgi:hypothetical protein
VAYIAARRKIIEEKGAEFKRRINWDWLEYEAVQKKNLELMSAWNCDTGENTEAPKLGSFINTMDGRVMKTGIRTSLNQKRIATASFHVPTWKCIGCTGHEGSKFWRDKRDKDNHKEVIVLADQAYPPILPCHGKQQCIKIIRVENGSIQSLTSEFLNLGRGYTLGTGSVVLIFSASHMAMAGTAGYVEDLLSASAQIRSVLGQHIKVAPAPHLFIAGCKNTEVIRICAEVSAWIDEAYSEDDAYLVESFRLANELLVADNDDEVQDDYTRRLRLPATNDARRGKRCWVMAGFYVKNEIRPTDSGKEAEILLSLIEGIRTEMAIDLDPSPSFDKIIPVVSREADNTRKRYLVVGGTHADNLTEAMRRRGDLVDAVVFARWRAQKKSVEIMVEKMKEAMESATPDVIILQVLDENVFLTLAEDGTVQPAREDKDGKTHVEGRLTTASADTLQMLMKLLEPLWLATEGHDTIVVLPLLSK